MSLIKSISGIRGTIGGNPGEALTPVDVVKFVSAYCARLKKLYPGKRCRVVVGRDARLSGEMVESLVCGTLMACGVDVVKNADVTNGRKLLILKDSYANSMIPYLSTNFSEIHLIDLRYYNFNVYDYMEEQGITDAAAIYSVKQLCDVSIANKLIVR